MKDKSNLYKTANIFISEWKYHIFKNELYLCFKRNIILSQSFVGCVTVKMMRYSL